MVSSRTEGGGAVLNAAREGGALILTIAGELNAEAVSAVWGDALRVLEAEGAGCERVIIDAAGLGHCDGAGMALLIQLQRRLHGSGKEVEVRDLPDHLRSVLSLYPLEKFIGPAAEPRGRRGFAEIGMAAVRVVIDVRETIAFIGELAVEVVGALAHPRRLRWRDTLVTVERAGVNALPVLALLSTLFGLILAFQSAVPMQKFGVELFVSDLVAIALLRELGPILTAIILAGRSGSAFAAELGTMKVNEEINALQTMGLSPVRFLALPRVAAGAFVAPLLAIFCSLCGLVGAGVVMLLFGYPPHTFINQVVNAVTYSDLLGGLLKAGVFGLLIAAVGCKQGLSTGTGASAVGKSTTRAVVAGLVLIIVADGLFAVVAYALRI